MSQFVSSGEGSWLWKLAVIAEDTLEYLSYEPESNIVWWLDKFPRLLGGVFSKGNIDEWARLLVQGAFCTRLANLLLGERGLKKEFVIVLLYVDKNFEASRYLFFQNSPGEVRLSLSIPKIEV